jgi:hypothetical protein
MKFSRWEPYKNTSWPYRVFNQYYEEQKWISSHLMHCIISVPLKSGRININQIVLE